MLNTKPSGYSLNILAALQLGRNVYGGTVPADVKAKRRAANRQARKSRRINRAR